MVKSVSGLTGESLGLFADLYELTMAQTYFNRGMFAPATFDLFVRSYPPQRGYLVCAGLEEALEGLEGFRFDAKDIDYLRGTRMFTGDFLDFLGRLSFTGSVRAVAEGRLCFADGPLVELTAPFIEAQLVETLLINRFNFACLQATKAARCVWAAQGRELSDFGARRAPGHDAAMSMARSGYIVGFESTSNVLAAQRYGIPPAGTMAHSLITAFPTEIEAFRAYAHTFPDRATLLLDTYDTIQGAHNAAVVGQELAAGGHRLVAVRLDSGDYSQLSRQVRRILDQAQLEYVKIIASGGLDEYAVDGLTQEGAPIDLFGIGAKVAASADAPYTDMSYKLGVYDGRPVMKLSPGKISPPGAKQVFRRRKPDGSFADDVVALEKERLPDAEPLLETVMEEGRRVRPSPTFAEMRRCFDQDFRQLERGYKDLYRPQRYPVTFSLDLRRLTEGVRKRLQENSGSGSN